MTVRSPAPYDVVIWGASGFTGKLVAEYLFNQYGLGQDLRWAIAGRNRAKLEALRDDLGNEARDLPILVGEALDPASLDEIVRSTRVLCSTVGPYSKFGRPLVAACAKEGVDYCDLAGEPHFIREMIEKYHSIAHDSGARIVCACGFDSIPSDLGVYFLNREALDRLGAPCTQIQLRVEKMAGGFSGGTAASMLAVAAAQKDPQIARILREPYSLNPEGERTGADGPEHLSARYDNAWGSWTAPFIMAGINTRVVRRSHALRGYPYGKQFRYDEGTLTGPGMGGRLQAYFTVLGFGLFFLMASFPTSRRLLHWLLPKSGEGPSRAQREAGSFKISLLGTTHDGRTLRAEVTGDRDPGYGSTSRMLGESAVCLAKQRTADAPGGVLTASFAMAEPLLKRLQEHAGLRFQMEA